MTEYIGMTFIVMGIIFDFLGVLGLVRLPDVYNRLQASTKCVTFGSIGILTGILIIQGFNTFGIKCLIGIMFICIASPTAAHAIARGAHQSGIKLSKKTVIDRYEEDKQLEKAEESVSQEETIV